MWGKIFAYLMAISFIGFGIFYRKSYHEKKFSKAVNGVTPTTGSVIGDIISYTFLFILSIVPWYIINILAILFGATLIILISIS